MWKPTSGFAVNLIRLIGVAILYLWIAVLIFSSGMVLVAFLSDPSSWFPDDEPIECRVIEMPDPEDSFDSCDLLRE